MSKTKETDQPIVDQEQTAESNEPQKIAQFKILDVFQKDLQEAVGDLPYNYKINIISSSQIVPLGLGDFLNLVKANADAIDINSLNFICDGLTYFPYNKIYKIVDKIREEQSYYFEELEPKIV